VKRQTLTCNAAGYQLVRSARRSLAIHIRQDGEVIVRAPMRMPISEIEYFVESRRDWIAGHLSEIAARTPEPSWIDGRLWWHLGETYPIQPQLRRRRSAVVMDEDEGVMLVAPALLEDNERLQAALWQWQKAQALQLLPERVALLVARHGPSWQPSALNMRRMRSRWGSCSKNGKIILNTHLLHAPMACIDYVICHEMAHMREFNHSPRFYAWQAVLCPDWRERKAELTRLAREFTV